LRTKFTFEGRKVDYRECFTLLYASVAIKKYAKLCQVCSTLLKSKYCKNSRPVLKDEKGVVVETVIKLESPSPSKVDVDAAALEIKEEKGIILMFHYSLILYLICCIYCSIGGAVHSQSI
jgi:hypothetical protein